MIKNKLYKDVSFWSLILLMIVLIFVISSCNPKMHVVGVGMRNHNLSQNKYQPKNQRKQVKLGNSPYSPVWLLLRRH